MFTGLFHQCHADERCILILYARLQGITLHIPLFAPRLAYIYMISAWNGQADESRWMVIIVNAVRPAVHLCGAHTVLEALGVYKLTRFRLPTTAGGLVLLLSRFVEKETEAQRD